MRLRSVADGQQVDIPVPHIIRTVGTHGLLGMPVKETGASVIGVA